MDYQRLGLGSASSLVRSIRIVDWGATVLVDCIYDPLGERTAYQLAFRGCSHLQMDMMPDAALQESEADLIGISLGEEDGRRPAVLTTDLFEFHVVYQQFQCVNSEHAHGGAEPVIMASHE